MKENELATPEKKRYRGDFNFAGALFTLYTHASSEKEAFTKMCYQLVTALGYSFSMIRNYFYNTTRYEVKEDSNG